ALVREADAAKAAGDPRSRGQVMADTLVERITGQARADDVPVTVGLVITDRALLEGDHEPAEMPGYGPVPAGWARDLLRPTSAAGTCDVGLAKQADVWLRRLFTHPATGELVAMETTARFFPGGLRGFLVARDQICRTPWCDAPVRHADHAVGHTRCGPTDAVNGQGLCEACNYTKQAPGWDARPSPDTESGRHKIQTTTPTGHLYASRPPPLPGPNRDDANVDDGVDAA
ncbi:MAG: HNH endonuclease, partial [Actinomycetes bacterium]